MYQPLILIIDPEQVPVLRSLVHVVRPLSHTPLTFSLLEPLPLSDTLTLFFLSLSLALELYLIFLLFILYPQALAFPAFLRESV